MITDAIEHRIYSIQQELEWLETKPPDDLVTCYICDGLEPEPSACGCVTGLQTVKDAIRFLNQEIEILCK